MSEGVTRSARRWSRPGIWLAIVVMAVIFIVGFQMGNRGRNETDEGLTVREEKVQAWTCSMHPQIILPDNDQKCPICFMDLIPLKEETGETGTVDLKLSSEAAALAEITTAPVERKFAIRTVQLVGKVAADETRTRTIAARIAGRLDRLYVDATGQVVTRGAPLAEIYSPDLYTAQVELQSAARAADESSNHSVLDSARERLRLWGMEDDQIQAILEGENPSEHVTVRAPLGGVVIGRGAIQGDYVEIGRMLYTIADLSSVWVSLEAFEADVAWLKVGQQVQFSTRAYPGREFSGEIFFINPVLDERTRTVEVRVQVDNSEGLLKPGMLASASVSALLDHQGVPVASQDGSQPPLVIPATAPLLTGDRAIVYVKDPTATDPTFSGREVRLGPRADEYFLVVDGLSEGEEVVVRGNFKIDSALQILARPSMMNGLTSPEQDTTESQASGMVRPGPTPPTPCLTAELDRLYAAYLDLQAALAADDDSGSAAAAGQLNYRLEMVECSASDLSDPARSFWVDALSRMRAATGTLDRSDDLGRRRLAFEPVSDTLWDIVSVFGAAGLDTLRRFHCPMAMDGTGANWLQTATVTSNPYYGASMLRCGSQVELAAGKRSP